MDNIDSLIAKAFSYRNPLEISIAIAEAYLLGMDAVANNVMDMVQNAMNPPPIHLPVGTWLPIETAPKDGTAILAICKHDADPYTEDSGCWLTEYGAWCESGPHVSDGPNIIAWGGGYDINCPDSSRETMPDWWFRVDGDTLGDEAACPIWWMPIPDFRLNKQNPITSNAPST